MKIYIAFIMIALLQISLVSSQSGLEEFNNRVKQILEEPCKTTIYKSGDVFYQKSEIGDHPPYTNCKSIEIYPNFEITDLNNPYFWQYEKDKQVQCYGFLLKENNLHHLKYDDTTQECTSAKVYDHETGYISPQTYETHHLSRWSKLKYYFKYLWGKWF